MFLECLIVRHAAANATEQETKQLYRILRQMEARGADDLPGQASTNWEFHRLISHIARHETASRILESLLSNGFQLQRLAATARLSEHRAIVAAIEKHDADAAEKAMRKHLSSVIERTRKRLASAQPRQLHGLDT
jgi:DNA-binding GntR family transcriptional regulator